MKLFVKFHNAVAQRYERGAAMAEYGLLLALVALAAIVVLAAFGDSIVDVFTAADTRLQEGVTDAAGPTE
jgi:Flp pilus assembly pilin Flp